MKISNFFSRAARIFRKCLALLEPGTRRKWVALLLLAVVVSLLEAIAAILLLTVLGLVTAPDANLPLPLIGDLTRVIPSLDEARVLVIAAGGTAIFFLVRAGIYLYQSYLQNRLAYQTGAFLARRLLRGYLAMPYPTYLSRNSSELIRNAHESTVALASLVLFPGVVLAAEAFVTLMLCIVLILSAPLAAVLAFFILGILVAVLLRFVQPRLLALGRQVQDHTTASLKSLQQALLGLRDIRVLRRESFFEENFQHIRMRLANAYAVRGVLIDLPRVSLETSVLLITLIFLILQVGGGPVGEGVSVLALFGYAAFRILPSVNRIVNNLQSLRFATALVDALHADVLAADAVDLDAIADEDLRFEHRIELQHVSFRYPGSSRDALSDVTLSIHRGESIGVVGRTGSGKSTLLDLILGLLEPTMGEVLIDDKPLTGRSRSWHRHVGVVPQTVFLIDDTIRNNIALGRTREDVDDDRVRDAVRIAQLEEFVTSLPDGLDSIVGERGVKLSGGQRQRLAIARAMYQRPQVLVFDEGTSALDSKTEADFLEALRVNSGHLTLISVAHRMTTIKNYDRVVLMRDGRIYNSGTYSELIVDEEFRALASEPEAHSAPQTNEE